MSDTAPTEQKKRRNFSIDRCKYEPQWNKDETSAAEISSSVEIDEKQNRGRMDGWRKKKKEEEKEKEKEKGKEGGKWEGWRMTVRSFHCFRRQKGKEQPGLGSVDSVLGKSDGRRDCTLHSLELAGAKAASTQRNPGGAVQCRHLEQSSKRRQKEGQDAVAGFVIHSAFSTIQ